MVQSVGDTLTSRENGARVFTVSNILSAIRILLLPFILASIRKDDLAVSLGLIAAAVLSDFLDGYLARRLNQISKLGKILDPVVDKVSIDALLITLVYSRGLPVWIPVAVIGRDLVTLFAGLFVMGNARTILSSDLSGKVATTLLWGMIVVHVLNIGSLKRPFILISLLCACISLIRYGLRAWWTVTPDQQKTDQEMARQYSDGAA